MEGRQLGQKTHTERVDAVVAAPHGWRGDYIPHAHLSRKNLGNALLAAVCMAPSLWATIERGRCGSRAGGWCALAIERPLLSANALFFANVSVGFWLVGLAQRSFWLIDPYWTLLPPMLGFYFASHPHARESARLRAALLLVVVWSVRLTHSYFRREEWKFGQREDWRYTRMADARPRLWWALSFFAVGLAQQPMLVGLSLPLYACALGHTSLAAGTPPRAWGWLDSAACAGCACGLLVAKAADDQLAAFMAANAAREARGERRVQLLEAGLWRCARHPNYFGETLFWAALGLLGYGAAGQVWVLAGAALNTVVLLSVTAMTEQRMLERPERREQYLRYMRTTSAWLPLPKFAERAAGAKAE